MLKLRRRSFRKTCVDGQAGQARPVSCYQGRGSKCAAALVPGFCCCTNVAFALCHGIARGAIRGCSEGPERRSFNLTKVAVTGNLGSWPRGRPRLRRPGCQVHMYILSRTAMRVPGRPCHGVEGIKKWLPVTQVGGDMGHMEVLVVPGLAHWQARRAHLPASSCSWLGTRFRTWRDGARRSLPSSHQSHNAHVCAG